MFRILFRAIEGDHKSHCLGVYPFFVEFSTTLVLYLAGHMLRTPQSPWQQFSKYEVHT